MKRANNPYESEQPVAKKSKTMKDEEESLSLFESQIAWKVLFHFPMHTIYARSVAMSNYYIIGDALV